MSRTRPSTTIVLLSLLLTSCALFRSNRNEPLDPSLLARLVPGTTTAREAVELLGGPAQVVQLGDRSAYRFDHGVSKGAALILVVFNVGHVDTREDRLWLFFDENDLLTHVGGSFQAHRTQYAMPWEDIHEESDRLAADRERGLIEPDEEPVER